LDFPGLSLEKQSFFQIFQDFTWKSCNIEGEVLDFPRLHLEKQQFFFRFSRTSPGKAVQLRGGSRFSRTLPGKATVFQIFQDITWKSNCILAFWGEVLDFPGLCLAKQQFFRFSRTSPGKATVFTDFPGLHLVKL